MRAVIGILVGFGMIWFVTGPAVAGPSAAIGAAATSLAQGLKGVQSPIVEARRKKVRKTVRRGARNCGWQCKPYWRPYQYRYWKFYYPHGGPLFGR